MIIAVDSASTIPPYEQIREQIVMMTASGVLPRGTRLPPIRQLAADLDLAPGTVTRAYRELEVAGVILAKGRHGTFVAGPPSSLSPRDREQRLQSEARKLARTARQLGAAPEETLAAMRHALDL
jgi:DNA-binding transcriptional regulator YhcF (GntR family)